MLPPVALQVTAVFVVPVTLTENCCVPPVDTETVVGVIETATTGVDVTVTVAEADLVASAALVAVTVYVPVVLGAVYRPELEIVPALAVQVTAVFVDPLTVAVNCCVAPAWMETVTGLIDTTIGAGALTVTVADADLVLSAALVAVTM